MALASYLRSVVALPACLATWNPSMDIPWNPMSASFWHLWRVSIDSTRSFPVFRLLCSKRTLVVSCALLVSTVVLLMSWSGDRFCRFCYHFCWVSALWDELRKLRLGVLSSVLSYVWWVPLDFFLLHRSVLTLLHFADMSRCTLPLLMHLWKSEISAWSIYFRNKVGLLTSSLFLSTQSTNQWTVLSGLLTILCPMLAQFLLNCLWVENALVWWRVNISQEARKLLR